MSADTLRTVHSSILREERRLFVSMRDLYMRMPEMHRLLQIIEQAPRGESELNDVVYDRVRSLDTAVAADVHQRSMKGMDVSLLRQCIEAGIIDEIATQLVTRYTKALEASKDGAFNGALRLEGVLTELNRLRSTINPYLRAAVSVGNLHAEAFLRATTEPEWESLTRLPSFMATRWNGLAHVLEPYSSLTLTSSSMSPFALGIQEQVSQEALRREQELTGTVQFILEHRN